MEKALLESFQQLEGIQSCGVLFSGGVDSSLAAILAKKFCDEIVLLTSCAQGARDSRTAKKAADILNLEFVETRMSSESVWNALPEVIYAIGRYGRMDVEIALPFFLSSREAKKRGINDIVTGQGPDELFAGYARHMEVLKKEGEKVLQKLLSDEISRTHVVNIERDKNAITYNGLRAHFPYLEKKIINIALSIPISWKIKPNETPSRKVIFRKLAVKMGLPTELAMKPKDATQYSSGSSKILIDAVRENVLSRESMSRNYANKIIQEILDIIAFEIGVADTKPTNSELQINLEATTRFLLKRNSSSHQR
jgi:asparagine synthase (glutamine-hydrolysing)